MGSMLGSVISATVLTILPEALRAVADYRMVVYAVVLILVMIFRPEGLMGSYDFSMSRVIERLLNHGKSYEEYLDEQNGLSSEDDAPGAAEAVPATASSGEKGGDA
jgi:branched-chain amino acid transport system permease protein